MEYILKLSISLAVIYAFYWLLLRRLTFYNWNRWYLVVYSAAAFLIPFINLSDLLQPQRLDAMPLQYIPAFAFTGAGPETDDPSFSWAVAAGWLAAAGSLFLLLKLLAQYYSLRRIRSHAVLLLEDGVRLYHVPEKIAPFSFGNSIFINQELHSEAELKEIIRHEFIHVKQKHSRDILWGELLCVLNWYNPFAWLIRRAIRQNLEFIADHQVLQSGIDRKQYQYLLLKVTGLSSYSIATNFSFSSLKKRIAMMNKAKSAKVHLVRFLFMLPVLAIVLLAFRGVVQEVQAAGGQINEAFRDNILIADTTKPTPAPAVEAVDVIIDTVPGAPSLPEFVRSVSVTNNKVLVTLKNGKKEKYNLNIPAEKAAMEKKYGKLLVPPPPPPPMPPPPPPMPPVPPAPPARPDAMEMIVDTAYLEAITVEGVADAVEESAAPRRSGGTLVLPEGAIRLDVQNRRYVQVEKAGPNSSVETFDFNDPAARSAYRKKFGDISFESVERVIASNGPEHQASVSLKGKVSIPRDKDGNWVVKGNGTSSVGGSAPRTGLAVTGFGTRSGTDSAAYYPLVVVDGVSYPDGKKKLEQMNPASILSIEVLKDAGSIKTYGDKGKNGVLLITTKKDGTATVTARDASGKQLLDNLCNFPGIVIVDNVEWDCSTGKSPEIRADQVASVEVIKDAKALEIYGPRGAKGVIRINTKR